MTVHRLKFWSAAAHELNDAMTEAARQARQESA